MGHHPLHLLRAAAAAAFAAVLVHAPSAQAQDYYAPPSAPIWTGVYGGLNLGADWSEIEAKGLGSPSSTDFVWGLHAGYNFGLGGLVLGIEGDANFNDGDLSYATGGGAQATIESDWGGSLRARLGVPVGPALIYGTLGYAWSSTNVIQTTAGGTNSSSDHTFGGIVYGIGAEAFVLQNVSMRLEALHTDYSADALSLGGAAGRTEVDPSDTVIRAGITFHLN